MINKLKTKGYLNAILKPIAFFIAITKTKNYFKKVSICFIKPLNKR